MTIKIWNNLKQYGFIMTPYTFIRSLGAVKATVLCQILAEYNHAYNSQLNAGNYFLSDLNRMADYLGLTIEKLISELEELEELNLIEFNYSDIKDIYMITVFENSIVKFKEQTEKENMYDDWNFGLLRSQNPINRLTDFTKPVQEIEEFVKKYIAQPIPIVIYAYCNYIIQIFESDGSKFLDLPNIWQELGKILNKYDFTFTDIAIWTYKKCTQK